jgi:hypothetical protein
MVIVRDDPEPVPVRQPREVVDTQTDVWHCTPPTFALAVGSTRENPIPRIVTEDDAADPGLLINPVESVSTGESNENAPTTVPIVVEVNISFRSL